MNNTCICGKIGSKQCSRCHIQRYCSIDCQKNDWVKHKNICTIPEILPGNTSKKTSAEILEYIKGHISSRWNMNKMIDELSNMLKRNPDDDDHGYMFLISKPKTTSLSYWTFLVCYHIDTPNTLYMAISDSPDGIIGTLRVATHMISKRNIVYRRDNKIDKEIMFVPEPNLEKNTYIHYDWNTGKDLGTISL